MLLQTNLQTAGFRVKVAGGWDKEDAWPQKNMGGVRGPGCGGGSVLGRPQGNSPWKYLLLLLLKTTQARAINSWRGSCHLYAKPCSPQW